MKRHYINENYFENIDSEAKAYILGFIYSDGCIYVHPTAFCLTITQLEQDEDILLKIKKELESDYPLLEKIQKSNDKKTITFYAYNKKIFDDLIKLGVTPKKSLTLKFPTFLNENLMKHFIRGYFDGDGCIWNGKRQKKIVKDKNTKLGYRERIVHNVKFTFTGNDSFITDLQKYLIQKIGIGLCKLNYAKAKSPKTSTSEKVCSMEYCGRGNIKKLYDYMYKDATIYGLRKYNKFKEIICAFDEKSSNETGLIAGNPLEP